MNEPGARASFDPPDSAPPLAALAPARVYFGPLNASAARQLQADEQSITPTPAIGLVSTPRFAEIVSNLNVRGPDFKIEETALRSIKVYPLNRFVGIKMPSGAFSVPPGNAKLGARAVVNGVLTLANVLVEGPIALSLDTISGKMTMAGSGQDENRNALRFNFEGVIENRPPTAIAGHSEDLECQTPQGAVVVLDGGASFDSDGQSIAHFQWFERGVGLGNTSAISTTASLGTHEYRLHVYDPELASDSVPVVVNVVDTTPPSLSLVPDEICVWPPNHEFVYLSLGAELNVTAFDTCDASVSPRIVAVTSDEPAAATGAGSTSPDYAFGPDGACVRAERTGPGEGRHYRIFVEARDASGNGSTRSIRVTVPHDASQHGNCISARGAKFTDARCGG